ncbi:GNAT family N-acetyltransferase [Roseobacteraceae bacterium NS-SX3]
MTLALEPMRIADRAPLATALGPYFAETAPAARIDPVARAGQMLNRKDVAPVWITENGTRAGFAVVVTLPGSVQELSEFTIFPPHRRKGLGQAAAHLLLSRSPGHWRLGISASSPQAAAFWGTCLSTLPGLTSLQEGAPFTAHQSKSYTFKIAGPRHD